MGGSVALAARRRNVITDGQQCAVVQEKPNPDHRMSARPPLLWRGVLWSTLYMDLAVSMVHAQGLVEVRDEDVARLSPLGYGHINFLGRYHFAAPDTFARGGLRALRDPAEAHDDELIAPSEA